MKKFFSKLLGGFLNFFRSEPAKILQFVAELTPTVAEILLQADVNGDGKRAAVDDLARIALKHADGWAKDLIDLATRESKLDDEFSSALKQVLWNLPRADFLQWLTIAKISLMVAERFGAEKVPALWAFRAVINPAYAATVKLKG